MKIKGVYRLSDYPDVPEPKTYDVGIEVLSEHFRPYKGGFAVITGIPGHGKSTVANNIAARMVTKSGWKVAFAHFEMAPVPYLRNDLRSYYLSSPQEFAEAEARAEADEWIESNFLFMDQEPGGLDEDDISLEWLIEKAQYAAQNDGIDMLVCDPWNEIEHKRGSHESETEYVGRAIRSLKRLARSCNIFVMVVAHPVKMPRDKNGAITKPNLYDISGSANWYNKCDFGVVVWRNDLGSTSVEWDQKKVRFRAAGKPGIVRLMYVPSSNTFIYDEARDLDND